MKNSIKRLLGFSIGPVIGAIISFITIPVTTYFIVPTEYGKVTMFTLLQSIVSMVICLGIDQSYTKFYHENKNKKQILFNCMLLPILLSIIIVLCMIIFAPQVSKVLFGDNSYKLPIYLLALSIPLMIYERFFLLSIRMQEKSIKYSLLSILVKVAILISTLFFVICIRKDFLAIVYATILGQIFGDIIIIFINKKDITFDIKLYNKELFKKIIKFGLPLSIVAIIGWALNSMDKVFLRALTNFEEIGYYNVAMKISNMLLIVQSCFVTFWIPTAYRWHAQNIGKEKFNLVSNIVSLGMSLMFILILSLKELIPIMISKTYEKSIYIMPFLLFYPIMYTMSETTTLGITFSNKSYLNIIVSIVSITINLVLNIILIPIFNAVGAAIATGIAYIAFFWLRTMISRKIWYKFNIANYIVITIVLVVLAIINSFKQNLLINIICNIIGILIVIFVYRKTILYIIKKIMKREKNNEKNIIKDKKSF